MQSIIYNIGKDRILDPEIIKNRLYFNLGNVENHTIDELITCSISKIHQILNLDLSKTNKQIVEREKSQGFYMNWHIDDCAIYKHNNTESKYNNILLNEKYSLYHKDALPKFTMIIYLSTINADFTGGEFDFINQSIKPNKFDVIFFDSREVHRVRCITNGTRKNIIVKFY